MAAEPTEAELQQQVEEYNKRVESPNDKIVCRREAVTGSRVKETVCRNVSRAQQEQNEAKRMLSERRPYPKERN